MSHKGGALVDRVDWLWGVIHGYTICLGLLYKLGQLSNQYFMRWEREKPRDLRYPRSLGSPGTLLLETPTHTLTHTHMRFSQWEWEFPIATFVCKK